MYHYRYHVHAAGDRDAERALLEPVELTILAPSSLGEDDQRVSVLASFGDTDVDGGMGSYTGSPVDLYDANFPHCGS